MATMEKLDHDKVKLTISVDADSFAAAVQQAYLKNRQHYKVQGFRAGKAPRKIIESHYAPSVAYFRKVNFIFAYFQNRDSMINECFAFMPKHVCLDLIDRCKKVLADHSLAAELLPTQAGFFFGSTEYDDWYFKDVEDCLKQLTEKCLPVYDEPCWEPGEVADQYKDEKMNLYWYFSW